MEGEQTAEPQTHEEKEQSKAMDKITDVGWGVGRHALHLQWGVAAALKQLWSGG